jgi:hypothetical protein
MTALSLSVFFGVVDCHFVAMDPLCIGFLHVVFVDCLLLFFRWVVFTCVLICLVLSLDGFPSLIFIYNVFLFLMYPKVHKKKKNMFSTSKTWQSSLRTFNHI